MWKQINLVEYFEKALCRHSGKRDRAVFPITHTPLSSQMDIYLAPPECADGYAHKLPKLPNTPGKYKVLQ